MADSILASAYTLFISAWFVILVLFWPLLSDLGMQTLQGISHWSVQSKSALTGWRINNFIELWCIVGSPGLKFWVSLTSFQKSNIGWPQQPPTEKVLNFNMIFHDSVNFFSSSKHESEAHFKNLNDSEVLSSDFPCLKTSAASITSTASTTSVASMTSTATFHQKFYLSWWLDHSYTPNDQYQSPFEEWIIKNSIFHWYLIPFCRRLLRPAYATFLKTGWWNSKFNSSWTHYAP